LLVDHITALREAVAATRRTHGFEICAFVVLPDHLQAVLKLPPGDSDFSTRWRLIKSRFARGLPKDEPAAPFVSRATSAASGNALLGASDPRRSRLRAACRILLDRPAQVWSGKRRITDLPDVSSPHRKNILVPFFRNI